MRKQLDELLTHVTTKLKALLFIATLITAPVLTPLAIPGVAHATSICGSVGVADAGTTWLDGDGVDICNHPGNGSNTCVPVAGAPYDSTHCSSYGSSGGYVWSGTAWECVEMVNRLYLTNGWTTATWYGSGSSLINNLPSGLTDQLQDHISYINPGDVATETHSTDGHAGIINSIDSNGTIHIKSQNADLDSTASITSGSLGAGNAHYTLSGWVGYSIQAIVHAPLFSLGAKTNSPSYIAKQNSYNNNPWVTEDSDSTVTQGVQSGSLTGVVDGGGFWVKQGNLGSSWVVEMSSGVASAAISDDYGKNTTLIGYVSTSGDFEAKQGISGTWVDEYTSGVAAAYLSGTRIGILTTSGAFLVKDTSQSGGMGASWVTEYTSGASQGILSGSLIGMIASGTYLVKQGALDSTWTTEYTGAASGQLSDAGYVTPLRIGVIDSAGNFYVKEGSLTNSWNTQWSNANGAVSKAVLSGGYVGVLQSGTYYVQQELGSLTTGGSWTNENTGITDITMWSPN